MPAFKDEKRNTYFAQFYYIDWMGKKQQKRKRGFKRKKDAQDWERDFLNSQARDCDITFRNFTDSYLEDMSTRLKETTIETKKSQIYGKLIPIFGDLKLSEIDALRIRRWQNELLKTNYAETYLKTINNQLSAMLNYAVAFYGLRSNPMKVVGSIGKSQADEMNIWTLDEFEHFISYVDKPAAKIAFSLLYWTGIREGELLALTKNDFLPNCILDINKSYAKIRDKEIIEEPKTPNSIRKIAIPQFMYDEAMSYINSLYGIIGTDRIFDYSKDYLLKEIKAVSKACGLHQLRVHDLRHSHASLLIEMGFNILMISKRLGHKSVETTWNTYAHLYPDKDKQIAFGLEKVKADGLSASHNPAAESQVLQLLSELKINVPNYSSYECPEIIKWNIETKEKQIIDKYVFFKEPFDKQIDKNLIYTKMVDTGYYHNEDTAYVYCFKNRGMPVEFL